MGAIALLIIVAIIVAARQLPGAKIQSPPTLPLWFWKGVQLGALLVIFSANGYIAQALVAPLLLLLLAPSFVLRQVVVPLGLPRFAYWVARCCGPVSLMREAGAGAAVYGALALARRPSSAPAIEWLELRVDLARAPRGAGVVAAGLLAALRGDRQRARALMRVADTALEKFMPMSVRMVARDWLIVDAARIGDWHEVVRLGHRRRHILRWSYALARIGERLSGDPQARRDWLLRLCWLVAPRRRATLPLLRRALAVPCAPKPTAEREAAASLRAALAGLADAIGNRFTRADGSFARRVGDVDAALDLAATRVLVGQRLRALGVVSAKRAEDSDDEGDVEAVLSGLRHRLADVLVPLLEEAPRLAGADPGPGLEQAVDRVRARLFRDVEAQCKDYDNRRRRERSLTTLAEWGAWAVLRDQGERLLELVPASENSLFHAMYVPVCNFAVFQHNVCRRRYLAHDMYSWLHRHAGSDRAASQLLAGNISASESP